MTVSAIYHGQVVHTRFRPVRHRLKHRLMWLLLDLDELPMLARRLRLFSLNRFNLVDFRDRDHGDGSDVALRAQVETALATRRAGTRWRGDSRAVHAARARHRVQSAERVLLPPCRWAAARDAVRGEQHIRRSAQLSDSGCRGRRAPTRAAPELRQAVARVAVHGHGDDLSLPHRTARRPRRGGDRRPRCRGADDRRRLRRHGGTN